MRLPFRRRESRRNTRANRRPEIEYLEGRQLFAASIASGDLISLQTRRDFVLASPQGIAPVTAIPDASSSDAVFTIVEAKGNGDGLIQDGERVALKSRRGMTLNSYDSRGAVYPIGFTNLVDDASDHLFTIRKAVPDGVPEIRPGDPILRHPTRLLLEQLG